jgi:hypothetical protein
LYVHQLIASVTQPVMSLKGFDRLTLKPGETQTVKFTVTPDMLSMLNVDMHRVVEPGVFELMVGPSSDDIHKVRLIVAGLNGETGKPKPTAPVPPGSDSGVVSTFDDGKVAANYGSWIGAGDQMNGGKSMATLAVVEPGASGSKGALQVTGEVVAGGPFLFAGALFSPAMAPMQPANLSGKKEISFWAKGDGTTYTLLILTESRNGQNGEPPAMTSFVAGPEWKQFTFPFSVFETDGSDLSGVAFIKVGQPGKFQFQLDQVEIK